MAKLKQAPENLGKILEGLGREFLGKDAILKAFEAIDNGVSYNYKVQFGDKFYILKVDNPKNGMRATLDKVNSEDAHYQNRFNKIVRFVNHKISKGMQAPRYLAALGKSDEFCIVAGEELEEFRGNIVSMQNFLQVDKPKSENLSDEEIASLARNMGILHRPTKMAKDFKPAKYSPLGNVFRDERERLTDYLQKETSDEMARKINILMTELSTNSDSSAQRLYQKLCEFFPEKKATQEGLEKVFENLYKFRDRNSTEILQLSHNDLGRGNILRDGSNVILIDFDELGRSGIDSDLFQQTASLADIFSRSGKQSDDLDFNQKAAQNFLANYLAYNPYLTKEELKNLFEIEKVLISRCAIDGILAIIDFSDKKEKSAQEMDKLAQKIEGREWMLKAVENPNEGMKKDILGMAYDEVFASISKGRVVEALIDPKAKSCDKEHLEHLDLAVRPKSKSWAQRVKSAQDSVKNDDQDKVR